MRYIYQTMQVGTKLPAYYLNNLWLVCHILISNILNNFIFHLLILFITFTYIQCECALPVVLVIANVHESMKIV